VFGLAALAESYGMPRLEERNINPWTAPGVVPGLLGIVIAILGMVLTLRSVGAGAFHPAAVILTAEEIAEMQASRWRLGMCCLLCFIYAVVLVGHTPFWFATLLYVFTFIVVFEWEKGEARPARRRKLAFATGIAVLSASVIPYVFETLFLVRLP